jgi:nucleoid-associated protein YgaU
MKTYTVLAGDDLSKIARQAYGSDCPDTVKKIFEANKGVIGSDPAQLRPGQVLNLP